MLFGGEGGGGRQTYPPPYKHDISLSNLAVVLTLRLLSSSIDRFYRYWSMSKVEKPLKGLSTHVPPGMRTLTNIKNILCVVQPE